jgi:hypothetical protein
MAEIKGSMLLNVARLIRANKEKDWAKYLNEKDLALIHSQILPSTWYPMDTYERAEIAVFHEIAQGKLEVARVWGRFLLEDMVKRVYQNLVEEQDPMSALQKFAVFRKQLLRFENPDFQALECKKLGPKEALMTVRLDRPVAEFEAHCNQTVGTFERLVELAGGKEVKAEILEHDYKGPKPFVNIKISWK